MAESAQGFDCAGSSNLERVDFDVGTDTLTITFDGGRQYDYFNVPAQVFREFQAASSKGQFFGRHVKGRYAYEER